MSGVSPETGNSLSHYSFIILYFELNSKPKGRWSTWRQEEKKGCAWVNYDLVVQLQKLLFSYSPDSAQFCCHLLLLIDAAWMKDCPGSAPGTWGKVLLNWHGIVKLIASWNQVNTIVKFVWDLLPSLSQGQAFLKNFQGMLHRKHTGKIQVRDSKGREHLPKKSPKTKAKPEQWFVPWATPPA